MLINDLLRALPMQYSSRASSQNVKEAKKLVTDSRKAGPGDAFLCLVGSTTDSHAFADSAYRSGCRVFFAQKELALPSDADIYYLEDTRRALPYLAEAINGFPSQKLELIGITGTKGKTTTASMLFHILRRSGIPCGMIGTRGIFWNDTFLPTQNTTPDPLILSDTFRRMLHDGIKTVIMEVSSQSVLMHRIDALHFRAAVFTNLSHDHIGAVEHPTFENYKDCKKQLFSMCGQAFLNACDPYSKEFANACHGSVRYYSAADAADIFAENCTALPNFHTGFSLCDAGKRFKVELPMPGEYNVSNALAAYSVARTYGIPGKEIADLLQTAVIDGRFEIITDLPGVTFIIDYAHNGASTEQVLQTVRETEPKGRIIVLYGSVGGRTEARREEIAVVCESLADFSILTSDNPDNESPQKIIDEIAAFYPDPSKYLKIPDREKAIYNAVSIALPGDVVLLLGKGHETYQIVNGEKVPFCEREILKKAIEKRINHHV